MACDNEILLRDRLFHNDIMEICIFVLSLDLDTCYHALTFISGEALSAKYISVYFCS